ncbi:SGNH/GDSL hydrolase family protein [Pseudarthrobacter sp. L1SW]|uniref:SGNH/GDSL hydrolase family protein n=1 Tax=Pseudarthrobacter sp. L1SW TaxID=2851598 RepID=UPI001E41E4FF|nr:SGNH/GDSL hydrolase family protein [Pseudarthrobacter sp. L1SW]UEL28797.1 SGNH/GDSL hydrolase family protein [Pseudarthrobacter sp. L1SW]
MTAQKQEHPAWASDAGHHPWHRFVALGDSFTEGVGDPEPGSQGGLRGWADRVAEELSVGQPDFAYANLAIRGLRLQEILDQQVGPALAAKPDLVTLSAGGNDIVFRRSDPDKLAEKIDAGVEQLARSGATVVLFAGPDWGATPVFGQIRGKVAIFNENLHIVAARHDAVIVDLWCLRDLTRPGMWDPDRLHFSPLGHHTIAIGVLQALAVPHGLEPLQPKALPPRSWKESRAQDLAWAREYLVPWAIRQVRHPTVAPPAPKRPRPGPVVGHGHSAVGHPGALPAEPLSLKKA